MAVAFTCCFGPARRASDAHPFSLDLQPSKHFSERPPAVTGAPLLRRGELREALAQLGIEEQRVVAKPSFPYRPVEDDAGCLGAKHLQQVALAVSAIQQTKRAVRSLGGKPLSFSSRRTLLASSSAFGPAKRAERTPGSPPSASTTRPESSAKTRGASRRDSLASEPTVRP